MESSFSDVRKYFVYLVWGSGHAVSVRLVYADSATASLNPTLPLRSVMVTGGTFPGVDQP